MFQTPQARPVYSLVRNKQNEAVFSFKHFSRYTHSHTDDGGCYVNWPSVLTNPIPTNSHTDDESCYVTHYYESIPFKHINMLLMWDDTGGISLPMAHLHLTVGALTPKTTNSTTDPLLLVTCDYVQRKKENYFNSE